MIVWFVGLYKEVLTRHNGWVPRFESNKYFAIKVNQKFLIQPFRHTQGPQGYQNIHKNILQMNLMSYNLQINPNMAKKAEKPQKCPKNDSFSCLHFD